MQTGQNFDQTGQPAATQLFFASVIATAMTYVAGALFMTIVSYFGQHSGGIYAVVRTFGMFATIGMIAAAALTFLVVAPLGTTFALAVLRVSPPAWWQGPLTGALVAITLELIVVFGISREPLDAEWGNVIVLTLPVVLAMIAGGLVQRHVLHWPE